jgi:hypothetical protein
MPNNIAANVRQIIYGAILVLVMMSGKNGLEQFFAKMKGRN